MFINLTPHSINLLAENGQTITIEPSGQLARCSISPEKVDTLDGIPVMRTSYGGVQGLPDPQPGTVYIASSLVAMRAKRSDVLSPDTGPTAIRTNGQVVAVRALQSFAE